jgi:hypothetical protein
MATIWIMILPAYIGLLVYVNYAYDYIRSSILEEGGMGFLGIVFIYFLLPVILLVIDIWCIPQWYSFIELDSEGMQLNTIYRKKNKIPYRNLSYFQIASYRHVYRKRFFLLLGVRGVSLEMLTNINRVQNSETLVKIKLSPRTNKMLLNILPDVQKEKLKYALQVGLPKVAFDTNVYIERKKQKIKKRKNRKR